MSTSSPTAVHETASTISLPIEGMTCASCVGRVEAALAKVEGSPACRSTWPPSARTSVPLVRSTAMR
ncbi:hypothetical protein B0X78_11730 [bacterium AM6]|nr:hypothetical protein B0X78_11730 [bacterium AM6]